MIRKLLGKEQTRTQNRICYAWGSGVPPHTRVCEGLIPQSQQWHGTAEKDLESGYKNDLIGRTTWIRGTDEENEAQMLTNSTCGCISTTLFRSFTANFKLTLMLNLCKSEDWHSRHWSLDCMSSIGWYFTDFKEKKWNSY